MVENVFILGAGASRESGGPLMSDFLDVAEDHLRAGKFQTDSESINKVFNIISELQQIHAKSNLDLTNIETLFGALEMAIIINQLGKHSKEEIIDYRDSLIRLIVTTIELSMKFRRRQNTLVPHGPYLRLANILNAKILKNSAIITFNYDMGIDAALHSNEIIINYGLDSTNDKAFKLLKLHGSINWVKEINKNGTTNIYPIYWKDFNMEFGPNINNEIFVSISNQLNVLAKKLYNIEINNNPVIIPPTWNKTEYHGTLTNVWSTAANALNSAKNVFVFGYSLPETDSFFRYLFALGSMGEARIRRFWVFDPDSTGIVKNRYETMLGQGLKNRFTYFEEPFGKALGTLQSKLKISDL